MLETPTEDGGGVEDWMRKLPPWEDLSVPALELAQAFRSISWGWDGGCRGNPPFPALRGRPGPEDSEYLSLSSGKPWARGLQEKKLTIHSQPAHPRRFWGFVYFGSTLSPLEL